MDPPPPPLNPAAEFEVHRPDSSIFKRGGAKREAAADAAGGAPAAGDAASLAARLAAMRDAWAAPRTCRGVTVAGWTPAGRVAVARAPRSKLAPRVGFHARGVLHLHPEEAAFLADRGDAVIVVGREEEEDGAAGTSAAAAGGPSPAAPSSSSSRRALSLQESWTLAAATGAPVRVRLPYGVLMRAGYTVRRAPPTWYLPPRAPLAASWVGPGWVEGRPPQAAAAEGGEEEAKAAAAAAAPAPPARPAAAPPPAKRARVQALAPPSTRPSRPWWPAAGAPDHPWCAGAPPDSVRVAVVTHAVRPAPPPHLPRLRPFSATHDGGPSAAAVAVPSHALAVHRVTARFARRRPDPPIALVAPAPRPGAPPTRAECWGADGAAGGVPARWAVGNGGGVSFFAFRRVVLADAAER